MEQSAVEWYSKEHWKLFIQLESKELSIGKYAVQHHKILDQAKENEQKQKDEFAIGFAIWYNEILADDKFKEEKSKELLEIYKKEKEL